MSLRSLLIFFKSIFNSKASNFNNSIIVYLLRKKIYWDVSYLVLFPKHFELWNFSSSKKLAQCTKLKKEASLTLNIGKTSVFEASCLLSPESFPTILSRCWLISPTKKPQTSWAADHSLEANRILPTPGWTLDLLWVILNNRVLAWSSTAYRKWTPVSAPLVSVNVSNLFVSNAKTAVSKPVKGVGRYGLFISSPVSCRTPRF